MSIVVRMEMPKNCFKCPLHKFGGTCGLLTGITAEERMNIDKRRPSQCPIICSLPEGHGRLVDIDRKFLRVANDGHGMSFNWRGSIADMIDKDNMRGVEIIVPAEAERSE